MLVLAKSKSPRTFVYHCRSSFRGKTSSGMELNGRIIAQHRYAAPHARETVVCNVSFWSSGVLQEHCG
jgi:hypothetical protein